MLTPRSLRTLVAVAAFAGSLVASAPAQAQFANHSIGFELGGMWVTNPDALNVGSGGILGINSTLYIESGFELYFRLQVGIHHVPKPSPGKDVFGMAPGIGFRYLFSEDTIRPYLGLLAAYDSFFMDTYSPRITVAPFGGLEFFVADNFSIGVQAEYHLLLWLNESPEHSVTGVAKVGWYF